MKNDAGGNLWKCIFPSLSVILWIATFVIPFVVNGSTYTDSNTAMLAMTKALCWRSACCIGAIISTAASYVIIQIAKHIEK